MDGRGLASSVCRWVWLAPAVAAFSVVMLVGAAGASDFDDDDGGVHEPAIDALASAGFLMGTECGQGLICPDDPVVRWVMSVWLTRALDESPSASTTRFADVVPNLWWAPHVERFAELGISRGCAIAPTRFCPRDVITRAHMATFLVRAFDLDPGPPASFVDIAGHNHAPAIDALAAANIAAGCDIGPTRFCPDEPVTRGEMATFVARALGLVPRIEQDVTRPEARFTAIATGGVHTCGLRSDGAIRCWDNHDFGPVETPTGKFTAVTTGRDLSCALRTDGAVTCWGFGGGGQSRVPEGRFTEITVGRYHSCGLRTDASVTCWGYNFYRQAGAPGGRFTAISVGEYHSCGLRGDGTAVCWGWNEHGQSDAPIGQFTAVAAGGYHSCGLRGDGTAVCWGWNEHGQSDAPIGQFTAVAAGGYHSCGLRGTGAVVCWGDNGDGRLDVPSGRFTAVTIGDVSTCGLLTGGTDACWGNSTGKAKTVELSIRLAAPVDGPITSRFGLRLHPVLGYRVRHDGVDLSASGGDPIHTAAGGVVILAGRWGGYGRTVVIDHGGGLSTLYAHQSSIRVSVGDEVFAGDVVGYIGCSGYCTGSHLHFEVRELGVPVDPMLYLGECRTTTTPLGPSGADQVLCHRPTGRWRIA